MPAKNVEHAVGVDVKVNVKTIVAADDDITSWALVFTLVDDGNVVAVTKSVGAGIAITGVNSYSIDLSGGDSANLAPGRYRYTVRITNSPKRARDVWGYWTVEDWP